MLDAGCWISNNVRKGAFVESSREGNTAPQFWPSDADPGAAKHRAVLINAGRFDDCQEKRPS